MFLFTLKDEPEVCVEVENLIPERLKGMKVGDVRKLKVKLGKYEVEVGELFEVRKNSGEEVVFEGLWLERVKRIGFGMSSGCIVVKGNAGMYAGAFMKGGRLVIEGNADRFAGMNMSGGELLIKGDAGDYLGSGYRGDDGMRGGKIVVHGNTGDEAGIKMRGGEIIVKGNAGMFFGGMMRDGIVRARSARRAGANMKGGTIVLEEVREEEILPGFSYAGKDEFEEKIYHVFEGDKAVKKSKGKLLVRNLIGED